MHRNRWVFPLFLVSVLGYYHFGLWQFLHCLFPSLPFLLFIPVAALLFVTIIHVFHPVTPIWAVGIRAIGSYYLGFFMTTFFLLIPVHICLFLSAFFVEGTAYLYLTKILGIILFAIAIIYCLWASLHATRLFVKEFEFTYSGKNPSADLHVALISDIHLGAACSEQNLRKIVSRTAELSPDLILIAGDLFNNDFSEIHDPDSVMRTLSKLQAPFGTYWCPGNHDAGPSFPQMCCFAKEAGITLLAEETAVIKDTAILWGRADASPIGGNGGIRRSDCFHLPVENPDHLPVFVLDHTPSQVDQYGADIDLVVSGHTHKGQLFPAGMITKRLFPVDYGHFRKDSQSPHVVVTSGAGVWGMPMRLGSDCEIVSIHIHS